MNQENLNAIAIEIFRKALTGVSAASLLEHKPISSYAARPLEQYQAIRLLAIGKGALPLAGAVEAQLVGLNLADGLAVVPHGYPAMPLPDYETAPGKKIEIMEA